MIHPAAMPPQQLTSECRMQRVRRSGPGGQHRNKVETGVVLCHGPTGLTAEANERRSQAENRKEALFRLRLNLALAIRLPDQPDGKPSALWQSRCGGGRIAVRATHDDFPAILAEALDAVHTASADVRRAAAKLGCTASQLTRLLKKEPRALVLVNQWRRESGLRPLQ